MTECCRAGEIILLISTISVWPSEFFSENDPDDFAIEIIYCKFSHSLTLRHEFLVDEFLQIEEWNQHYLSFFESSSSDSRLFWKRKYYLNILLQVFSVRTLHHCERFCDFLILWNSSFLFHVKNRDNPINRFKFISLKNIHYRWIVNSMAT